MRNLRSTGRQETYTFFTVFEWFWKWLFRNGTWKLFKDGQTFNFCSDEISMLAKSFFPTRLKSEIVREFSKVCASSVCTCVCVWADAWKWLRKRKKEREKEIQREWERERERCVQRIQRFPLHQVGSPPMSQCSLTETGNYHPPTSTPTHSPTHANSNFQVGLRSFFCNAYSLAA